MSRATGLERACRAAWLRRAVRGALLLVLLLGPSAVSAHRLDEYLQATRVAVEGDRVSIEVDLTPGVAVAQQVFEGIDNDRDGQISVAEADAYARLVLDSIVLEVDSRRQTLLLVDRAFPPGAR